MTTSKLHITTKHTGKMEGMISLSTACTCNPLCKERAEIEGSICQHCYSQRMFERYSEKFSKPFIENYEILNKKILEDDELPRINASYFRFEAFGDVASDTQYINYLKIAFKNPDTNFAIWTKNINILRWVHNHYGWEKPENLQIIYSGMFVNVQDNLSEDYWFVDKIFTVYTKEFTEENCIIINCGKKKCMDCLLCYSENKIHYINELLK